MRHLPDLRLGEVRLMTTLTTAGRRTLAAASQFTELGARGEVRFLGIQPRSVLNAPSSTGMAFWSLNPYVGCEFGCAYCYARRTHRWTVEKAANTPGACAAVREAATLPSAHAFERRILVKENAEALLRRALPAGRAEALPIVIGSATDPYQPAERRFRLTRSVLEVFRAHEGYKLTLITKSALVARDASLLAEIGRRHDVSVYVSLASLDGALLRCLEPRTPAPHARLRAMRQLADAGVRVGVLIAPVLPGLTDSRGALRALLAAARDAGARMAGGGPLRMGPATRHVLLPWLDEHRPALARRYRRHFANRQGVEPSYAAALAERMATLQAELGYDVKDGMRRERPTRAGAQTELFA